MLKRFCRLLEPPGVIVIFLYIQAFALSSCLIVSLLLAIGSFYFLLSEDTVIATCTLIGFLVASFIISSVALTQARAVQQQHITSTRTPSLKLIQLEKEKEHWLYLNHELRNMVSSQLMAARSLVTFLAKYPEFSEDRKLANGLLYSLSQSERLYNSVIDVARLEAGIFDTANETAFQARDWLQEHTDFFTDLARGRSIRCILSISAGFPSSLLADENKLLIIFNNILVNAFAHTPQGGDILVVATATTSFWAISITNSGKEIPPRLLPHLFDKYKTGHGISSGTSGIGLYLAAELARTMQGKIHVSSEKGRTNFTLTLPLKEPSYAHLPKQAKPFTIPDLFSELLKSKIVLVVEDDELIQTVLQHSLSGFGFGHVLIASNGEDGTRMAEEYNPNFILLDIQLPGKDGDELLSDLRASAKTQHTPIIAITAAPLSEIASLRQKHNLCAVLPKPVPEIDLFYILTAC